MLAVGGPAEDFVGIRVGGEAFWNSACGGHGVDVDVAVVLGAESDGRSVWREKGIGFDSWGAGESFGFSAASGHRPKVAGILKDDRGCAEGRVAHQHRVRTGVELVCLGGGGNNEKRSEDHWDDSTARTEGETPTLQNLPNSSRNKKRTED